MHDLRLVVGTKEFVQENNAGISLYPDAFVLSQNYPNPFNPQTSIMISLEEDARVDMVIYSLQTINHHVNPCILFKANHN